MLMATMDRTTSRTPALFTAFQHTSPLCGPIALSARSTSNLQYILQLHPACSLLHLSSPVSPSSPSDVSAIRTIMLSATPPATQACILACVKWKAMEHASRALQLEKNMKEAHLARSTHQSLHRKLVNTDRRRSSFPIHCLRAWTLTSLGDRRFLSYPKFPTRPNQR